METYRHFGLNGPPFDGQPDPRFYCSIPSHAEALATLQYAVHSHKACTLVLGESGSGKTLLARIVADGVARRVAILWVHGLTQADGRLQARFTPPGGGRLLGPPVEDTTLQDWLQSRAPHAPAVVIIDNADGLRDTGWQDVLDLITREGQPTRSTSVILLGLPELLNTLARPELIRVQRRIFRTCRLTRLTHTEVALYVRHRLRVAGLENDEIFTPAALEFIHRFSDGNPALVNQLCENALVEAFSEERKVIDARHVLATAHAISGGTHKRHYLPGLTPEAGLLPQPLLSTFPRAPRRVPAARFEPTGECNGESPTPLFTPPPAAQASPSPIAQRSVLVSELGPPDALAPGPAAPLDERLRALESRLNQALARVRDARRRPRAAATANGHSPRPAVTIVPVILPDGAPAEPRPASSSSPAVPAAAEPPSAAPTESPAAPAAPVAEPAPS